MWGSPCAEVCALLSTEGDASGGFRTGSGFYNKFGSEFVVSALTNTSITKGVWGKRIGEPVGPGNHFAFTTAEA